MIKKNIHIFFNAKDISRYSSRMGDAHYCDFEVTVSNYVNQIIINKVSSVKWDKSKTRKI